MYAGHAAQSGAAMMDDTDEGIRFVTERLERRLAEENGKLRVEMATEFGKIRADMATELGKVRADMATGFGEVRAEMAAESGKLRAEMTAGFGGLRAEMIDRNAELLKWGLLFGATQTAALAGVMALLR